jgi:hypothetical protein
MRREAGIEQLRRAVAAIIEAVRSEGYESRREGCDVGRLTFGRGSVWLRAGALTSLGAGAAASAFLTGSLDWLVRPVLAKANIVV